MVDGKPANRDNSVNSKSGEKHSLSAEKPFDKVMRLFRANGIIYGNSVCNTSINKDNDNRSKKE